MSIPKCCRAIVDELGRGTSTRDGLCIAIAIAEALVSSKVSSQIATYAPYLTSLRRLYGSLPISKTWQLS